MPEELNKKRANLRDVARAAGVSVATVSRVLNSPDVVSEDTRRKVQSVIDCLHFVPSAAARAINSGRTRVVGALVSTLDNAIFAKFLAALEQELDRSGLSLVVATTEGNLETEAEKARRLVDIGAEALIVSGITHSPAFDALVARTRLPTIATSYYDKDYALPTIGYDNAAASRLALQFLYDAGHRQIAVIHGPAENNDRTRARLAGLEALAPDIEIHSFETDIALAGGALAVQNMLAAKTACTAVLCTSDVLALGALLGLQKHGLTVPTNISLVGIDDLPASSLTVPGITSVHLPVARMGRMAAEAAVQWIEHDVFPESKLIEVELIVRGSTREIA